MERKGNGNGMDIAWKKSQNGMEFKFDGMEMEMERKWNGIKMTNHINNRIRKLKKRKQTRAENEKQARFGITM